MTVNQKAALKAVRKAKESAKHPNALDVPLPTLAALRPWGLRPEDLLGDRNERNPYIHYIKRTPR